MITGNLVIHDLAPAEWDKISGDYTGWNVVSDNGSMHPCTGCFSCWNRVRKVTVNEIARDLCVFFHQESVLITEDIVRTYYVRESL